MCACCWRRTGCSPAGCASSCRCSFNGRDTLVEFDAPLSLRELLGAELAATTRGRRVARSLHALYARRRAVRIGPDLSHRRTIVNAVLRTRAVRAAVTQELRAKHLSRRKVMLRARADALEIAANYSHVFVRFMEHALALAVEPPVRRRRIRARRDAGAGGRGARAHLRALPPQPHGLPAAQLRDLRAGLCRAARRRRGESQPAGDRALPAQGRRVLHPPHAARRHAVCDRAHEVSGHHHGARAPDRVLHRGRPQPHRAAAAAQDRHARR